MRLQARRRLLLVVTLSIAHVLSFVSVLVSVRGLVEPGELGLRQRGIRASDEEVWQLNCQISLGRILHWIFG